jgi:hypothetical protein
VTRDDIIRMAREAGCVDPMVFFGAYERFATLVASERDLGWHKIVHDECEAAIKEEREACAKVCENDFLLHYDPVQTQTNFVTAIRARGEK